MISPRCPPYPAYRGEDTDSFAHPTVFKRWPVILQQVIDDVLKHFEGRVSEVCNQIAQIQTEISEGVPMPLLKGDQQADLHDWNDALQKYFPQTTFHQASWLFAECYLYRRIWNIMQCSPETKAYDPFGIRKQSSLDEAFPKMVEAAKDLHPLMASPSSTVTRDLLLMSLWGNATDLSMFAGLTQEQMKTMTASNGEDRIICNDLDEICAYIKKLRHGRIDFVLDNNGFELFGDLLLADHLHRIGAATTTVFHCKAIPWFVSDTTLNDFEILLSSLENTSNISGLNVDDLHNLVKSWRDYLIRGEWVLNPHYFWTSWWAYYHLPEAAPSLFSELLLSSLVFFKGDLNYRKLVYDCRWPSTTPFREAIGEALASKVALVALRTNKSDPCVGLAKNKETELISMGCADWRWSGKFAVIQFSKPEI